MCDPVSLAVGASVVAGGVSAFSARSQGRYQAAVAERNAEGLERSAADASLQGVAEAEQQRNRYKSLIGRQVTSAAASGLDVSTGSPLDIFSETATFGEFDAQVVESNARRQAFGLQSQAVGSRSQGRLARSAGQTRAFTTLLTTGAQAYSMGQQLSE